jgi:hypothetical protein
MASTIDIEKRLLLLDRELHSILDMVKKKSEDKKVVEIVESVCGAWDYDIDSTEFVDQLRQSRRLDWVK